MNPARNIGSVCIVFNCRYRHSHLKADSTFDHIRFHCFPRDPHTRNLWIERCAHPGNWNPDVSKVCSIHFCEEDYERDLKSEQLNIPRKWILKQEAVPSLNLNTAGHMDRDVSVNELPTGDQQGECKEQCLDHELFHPSQVCALSKREENAIIQLSSVQVPPRVKQLCRICAGASKAMWQIFKEDGKQKFLAEKIHQFLPIMVYDNDRLPLQVCETCVFALDACEELVQRCKQADEMLRRLLLEEDKAGLNLDSGDNYNGSVKYISEPSPSQIRDKSDNPAQEDTTSNQLKGISNLKQLDMEAECIPLAERLATIKNEIFNNTSTNQFSCWECGATLGNLSSFIEHQKFVHSRELRPCPVCGSIFETEALFSKHWKKVHPKHAKISLHTKTSNNSASRERQATKHQRQKSPLPVPIRRSMRKRSVVLPDYLLEDDDEIEPAKPTLKSTKRTPSTSKKEVPVVLSSDENNGDEGELYIPDDKPEPKNSAYKCKLCSKGYESKSGRRNHYVSSHNKHECKMCEELFPTASEAEQHEKQPHKIICNQCPEYFQSQSSLKMHISSKHLEGPKQYKCSQCNRDYVSKSALMTHEKLHKIKEPSVCDVCNKCCKTPTALKYHKFVHMTDEEKSKVGFSCTMCDKKFPGKTRLTLHMRRHNNERPCECPTCHKTFHDSERLKAHMEGHSTEKRFKCDQCDACFVSKRYLVNHMYLSHRRKQVIRCIVCKTVFPSMKEVMVHQKTHTPEELEQNNATPDEPFTKSIEFHCKECNEYFSKKDLLRIHKARYHAKERVPNKISTPIKQLDCKICGKKVWGTAGLSRHMRVHSGNAPARTFQCEFCAKLFAQKMQMVLHIRTHTGEKPFQCQFCNKGFINVNSLVVHERIHTGDNPFKCDKCPKAFRSNSNLVAHLQTHSDIKPYECHYCHKKFGRLIHLKLHLRTHTGERPYACDVCGRAFTQGGDMRKHRLTHTGERAYKCDTCDFSSNKRKTLVEHQAVAHSQQTRVLLPPLLPPPALPELHHNNTNPIIVHTPQYHPPQPPPLPTTNQTTSSNYLKLYENWSEN